MAEETRTDPVCGMNVEPAGARHRSTFAGREHVFCSAGCKRRFDEDPRAFVEAAPPRPPRAAAAGTQWTCPMHPEVVRDAPGNCPICGMALEPRVPVAAEPGAESAELRDLRRRFRISAAFALPLVLAGMLDMLPGHPVSHLGSPRLRALVELLLATVVCTWAAWPFYRLAWRSVADRARASTTSPRPSSRAPKRAASRRPRPSRSSPRPDAASPAVSKGGSSWSETAP
jgi:Cu+-exporting ATPase